MSQRAQVLHMLRVAPGRKVRSEQFLAAGIPRYSARIWELRDLGHRISTTPQAHSKTVTFRLEYDVERASGVSAVPPPETREVASSGTTGSLSVEAMSSEAAQPEPARLPSSARGAA